MSECYLICRSLTYAQKTVRVFERWGMFAALVRMPAELRDGSGCGWCVRIRGGQLRQALNAVKSEHLPGVRTFCGNTGETLQEVGS